MSSKAKPDWTTITADFIGYCGSLALDAWYTMLILGSLHPDYHEIPSFGYWSSVLVMFVLSQASTLGTYQIFSRIRKLTPTYGKKAQ